jgi:glycosyltransferase involved in cell wall biosynthesis
MRRASEIPATALVHITHEAREKMGGIGAVLEGLLTTRAYQSAVDRTILVGAGQLPLKQTPEDIQDVLYETGGANGEPSPGPATLIDTFKRIETTYGVRILYGRRAIRCPLETRRSTVELLILDVRDALAAPVNLLKGDLWQAYELASDKFEKEWGYEEWVRLAGPAIEAIETLLAGTMAGAALVSHEFMGLPTLLAARLRLPDLRTIYWAHEVPSVRDLIETQAEHRLVFDQALETREGIRSYEALLRETGGFKHALVSRAHRVHRVFAVSDRTAQELELLSSEYRRTPVEVVYNGLPVRPIDVATRLRCRNLLRQYVDAVVGFRPDFVFTHVARPVASKAIERDLAVMEHLDDILADEGRTAVLLVLATDGGRREPEVVRQMESQYGWPLNHRVGWPDMVKGEVPIGQAAEKYNAWARATRAILINQFGLTRDCCGSRVPEGMTFQDLRQGSDVEFGQSAYEPFGIAQLETLAFGGISVISSVCGCAQLLSRVVGAELPPNVLMADYCAPSQRDPVTENDTRRIEHEVAARLGKQLAARLPSTPEAFQSLLESGWQVAEKMSWQSVTSEYFVPALERCLGRPVRRRPARRSSAGPRQTAGAR